MMPHELSAGRAGQMAAQLLLRGCSCADLCNETGWSASAAAEYLTELGRYVSLRCNDGIYTLGLEDLPALDLPDLDLPDYTHYPPATIIRPPAEGDD
jgi:hypothetical protein